MSLINVHIPNERVNNAVIKVIKATKELGYIRHIGPFPDVPQQDATGVLIEHADVDRFIVLSLPVVEKVSLTQLEWLAKVGLGVY